MTFSALDLPADSADQAQDLTARHRRTRPEGAPRPEGHDSVLHEFTSCTMALITETFRSERIPGDPRFGEIRDCAIRAARAAVPIRAILRNCHDVLRPPPPPGDDREILELALPLLETLTVTIVDAYLGEQRLLDLEHHAAQQTATAALLSGRGYTAALRHAGIPVAEAYQVIALAVPDSEDGSGDAATGVRQVLRRLRSGLVTVFRSRALPLLSPGGGTVLIPVADDVPGFTAEAAEVLSDITRAALTATLVDSAVDRIPEAADQAHDLLTLVRVGRRGPGLYRMSDLALEYQLTRGEAATRRIATVLDPLEAHPELFATMRAYLDNDLNRRLTARELFVHPNTVDYRLRRIAQLTPLDLSTTAGISQASIALLARDLDRGRATPGD